ncbi:hypothetical protein DFH07DRAFT_772135 [Mycena maculata]|uniref:Uncharacterized protein n=1 Tax=Mycena maculata TaxID=230809 RepID=A0AAD7J947_9AGAR|nr:hypothetical protein DFH07DRAFT_772135 [Mycena maculata]
MSIPTNLPNAHDAHNSPPPEGKDAAPSHNMPPTAARRTSYQMVGGIVIPNKEGYHCTDAGVRMELERILTEVEGEPLGVEYAPRRDAPWYDFLAATQLARGMWEHGNPAGVDEVSLPAQQMKGDSAREEQMRGILRKLGLSVGVAKEGKSWPLIRKLNRSYEQAVGHLQLDGWYYPEVFGMVDFKALSKSEHNVRIERLWRDVRKDTLEAYRQIFDYPKKNELLDTDNITCRVAGPKPGGWDHHRVRTERNRTRLHSLSLVVKLPSVVAGDACETRTEINELYGVDGDGRTSPPTTPQAQREAGLLVNDDDELKLVAILLEAFDLNRDVGNWGIDV